ncbi:hypothetical protein HDU76_003419 [Blyttiomyces sp. JEL0837]|nr:hypothetical protein HDU76_003419 [Blyttiomyces sp. JEL0837]
MRTKYPRFDHSDMLAHPMFNNAPAAILPSTTTPPRTLPPLAQSLPEADEPTAGSNNVKTIPVQEPVNVITSASYVEDPGLHYRRAKEMELEAGLRTLGERLNQAETSHLKSMMDVARMNGELREAVRGSGLHEHITILVHHLDHHAGAISAATTTANTALEEVTLLLRKSQSQETTTAISQETLSNLLQKSQDQQLELSQKCQFLESKVNLLQSRLDSLTTTQQQHQQTSTAILGAPLNPAWINLVTTELERICIPKWQPMIKFAAETIAERVCEQILDQERHERLVVLAQEKALASANAANAVNVSYNYQKQLKRQRDLQNRKPTRGVSKRDEKVLRNAWKCLAKDDFGGDEDDNDNEGRVIGNLPTTSSILQSTRSSPTSSDTDTDSIIYMSPQQPSTSIPNTESQNQITISSNTTNPTPAQPQPQPQSISPSSCHFTPQDRKLWRKLWRNHLPTLQSLLDKIINTLHEILDLDSTSTPPTSRNDKESSSQSVSFKSDPTTTRKQQHHQKPRRNLNQKISTLETHLKQLERQIELKLSKSLDIIQKVNIKIDTYRDENDIDKKKFRNEVLDVVGGFKKDLNRVYDVIKNGTKTLVIV